MKYDIDSINKRKKKYRNYSKNIRDSFNYYYL